MYSTVTSCAMVGVEPQPVLIETTVTGGHHAFQIVGLPDAAVRESRQRVLAAMHQQGFRIPTGRVLVNLSPADVPKVGATYDLPIALSVLSATFDDPIDFTSFVAVGELSLSGEVRPVRAALGAVEVARRQEKTCMVSAETTIGARYVEAPIAGIRTLGEAVAVARGTAMAHPLRESERSAPSRQDLNAVRGQPRARRALEIAAAGGHHLLMSGAPGAGKTLLARCLPGILPPLTAEQEREVALVWAAAGIERPVDAVPPFRSPHHSASLAAIVGGGIGSPRPGEVSKAHHGVLFLDELGEFAPSTLDALRQPIEDASITIARSAESIRFPASIQVVAATNPCPCGYAGDRRRACECSDVRRERYRLRLSGPLLDRFDVAIRVPRLAARDFRADSGEPSAAVRARVCSVREVQRERGRLNRELSGSALEQMSVAHGALDPLVAAMDEGHLTARGWDRVRRVARTIADLEGSSTVDVEHVEEAIDIREDL